MKTIKTIKNLVLKALSKLNSKYDISTLFCYSLIASLSLMYIQSSFYNMSHLPAYKVWGVYPIIIFIAYIVISILYNILDKDSLIIILVISLLMSLIAFHSNLIKMAESEYNNQIQSIKSTQYNYKSYIDSYSIDITNNTISFKLISINNIPNDSYSVYTLDLNHINVLSNIEYYYYIDTYNVFIAIENGSITLKDTTDIIEIN